MMERTGWTKATMSQFYNNRQDYSPKILNEAALALNVEPWELLMLPDRAMSMRRFREDAIRIAAEERKPFHGKEPGDESDRLQPATSGLLAVESRRR